MPLPLPEAFENRALDMLKLELAKIGTGMPGTWNMTGPVPVKFGLPGDALDATIKQQLYLFHAHTEEVTGDDTETPVGPNLAMKATFAIWCVTSATGLEAKLRGVLNLKADVLRALLAARGTFEAEFGYGLSLGPYTVDADLLKAGLYAGAQTVTIDNAMKPTEP